MGIQAFSPELSVEALDEGVVGWLSWPREVEHDTFVVDPQIEITGDEFGALVNPDRLGIAISAAHAFKCSNHILSTITEAGIRCRREAGERIDHC